MRSTMMTVMSERIMSVGGMRLLDSPLKPFRNVDRPRTIPAAIFRIVFCCVCVSLICATTALGQASLGDLNRSIAQLAEEVLPSVVQIESNAYAPILGAVAIQSSTGSGVILSEDGFIVTNAHVVSGATRIQVQLASFDGPPDQSVLRRQGRKLNAEIVGIDLETDLALLKVESSGLPALQLADSERFRQGQLVLAFGSPLGLENSVTMGIVSNVARQLEPESPMIYMQTDAPINPGNSGGPLVDVEGRVVGINTMIVSPSGASAGLGFAVPSNIVASIVEQLREHGVFTRGEIGIQAQTITPELAAGLGLERDFGVILSDVFVGGSAYDAGVLIGDIVLSLNEKPMENARQLMVNLYGQLPNRSARLELLRDGESFVRSVGVRTRGSEPQSVVRFVETEQRLVSRLGILTVPVDDTVRGLLPVLRMPDGLLVTDLALSADAPQGLFAPGDVLFTVNRQALRTVSDLEMILSRQQPEESLVYNVERGGILSFVVVQLY